MKPPVIVVGAGLFGSIAATLARANGYVVTVVDCFKDYGASKAAGCVLAPSWLSSLTRRQIDIAMGVLTDLYPVHELEFITNIPFKTFKAKRVTPSDVLVLPDLTDEVISVGDGRVTMAKQTLRGAVLVAAGVGSSALVNMPFVRALYGASVQFYGYTLTYPRLAVYAPYRQALAFNLANGKIWMGDGTALIEATWRKEQAEREAATVARGEKLFGLKGSREVFSGARPYVEGFKAGYFAQVSPRTWVSTGGAKNGTVLAAYQAQKFIEALIMST